MLNYSKSEEWIRRGECITPGGSQTRSKSPTAYVRGTYPAYAIRGEGSRVQSVDGEWWIDWLCAMGANALGHNHPAIVEAVCHQVRDGAIYSLPHVLEVTVSERFCAAVPAGQRGGNVRWVKTGSEACAGAMRIARAATGRSVIVTSDQSYHGWHDGFTAIRPYHPGVPEEICGLIAAFKYNDLDSLRDTLKKHDGRVAAVMLEPCLLEPPAQGFLPAAAAIARGMGALFILDEMILGGRLAYGGGSEYFGVTPDLACYGKAIGGGLPLACVVGRLELMKWATVISGTFSGDALALAACDAALSIYQTEPVIATMWARGTEFRDGLTNLIKYAGLPAHMEGYGVHPRLAWDHPEANLLMSLWLEWMAEGGVLVHPAGWNSSYAHSEDDVTRSLEAADLAFLKCARALREGNIRECLRGEPIQVGMEVRR